MNPEVQYALYHPKWYRRRVSVWWWLESWRYTKFVLRELTSLSVAFFAIICLWKISAIAAGPEAYTRFLARMTSPFFLVANGLAFLFVLFHAVTWFNLAPKAMVVRWRGKRVSDRVIQGMNYLLWAAITGVILWILRRG